MIIAVKIKTTDGFTAITKFRDLDSLLYFVVKVKEEIKIRSLSLGNLTYPYYPLENLEQTFKDINEKDPQPTKTEIESNLIRDWNLYMDRNTEDIRVNTGIRGIR